MGDIFGMPVFLNVNRRKTMSTNLGFLLSLLLLIIVFGQGIFYTIKMLNREQPQILQLNELKKDPPGVILDFDNNFNFGISLTVNGNLVNMSQASLLTFSASYNVYTRTGAGLISRSKAEISFAPCTPEDFPDSVYGQGNFVSYGLGFAYCPTVMGLIDSTCSDDDQNCSNSTAFNISGTYLSQTFTFLQMSFSICDNTNASLYLPADMQCLNLSNIYNTFYNDQVVKVNLYFSNNVIDPESYATPNQPYFDFLSWEVNPSLYKSADIFLDQEIVQDYSSLYSSTANYNQTFYSVDTSKVREQQNFLVLNQTWETLLQLNLRRSNFDVVTTRIYEKIQDMLSQVGGFAKSIMFALAFIAMGYARYKYQMVLSNELYDFEPPDDYSYKRRRGTIRAAMRRKLGVNANERDKYQLREGLNESFSVKHEGKGEDRDVADRAEVKEYFEYQRKKRKRLPYNEMLYLKTLLCCCRKITPEEELGAKARVQAEEDVDLIKILTKLKEIDKLKILLMDRDQRELFNYIPRPLIELDTERPRHYSFDDRSELNIHAQDDLTDKPYLYMRREEFDSLSKYGKLYIAYRGANESDTTDIDSKKYNEKLLGMLGPELIRVFRLVDKEAGDQANMENFETVISKMLQTGRRTRAQTPSVPKSAKVEQKPAKKEKKEPVQVFNRKEFVEMNSLNIKNRSLSK